MARENTRKRIIRGAQEVVLHEGLSALTLDQVAQRAGVSKGGLLYHFPGKEALVEGMVADLIASFEERLQAERSSDIDGVGQFLPAYLAATFDPETDERRLAAGLLAAVATNPGLLRPLQEKYRDWESQIEGHADPVAGLIVRLAVDGLWFAELFGLATPDEPLRSQVLKKLREMAVRAEEGEA